MTGYRRDIDGMRAMAIVPVVLCHLKAPYLAGGFVGVDVFFVISGFLIAGIVSRELDAGAFSFVHFYERRARRILPALFVMIAFVVAGASLLYMPTDFADVPKSALMTLTFLANFWFFSRTGYFSEDAWVQPLLHCWSLAVEEQFYLAMPLLLWAIARFVPHLRTPLLAGAGLLSFGLCLWIGTSDPAAAFYLPMTRAWELIAGALLATTAIAAPRRPWLREGLALGGLGLICFAVLTADSEAAHPGLVLLPPVLGTLLLLHCAPGTLAGRLLAMRLPVGIGLISYSLYLWHWPLIAFGSYLTEVGLPYSLRIGLVIGSVFAAWASWRFIERPFRDPARISRKAVVRLSAAGIGTLALAASGLLALGGWESRFPADLVRIAAVKSELRTESQENTCMISSMREYRSGCRIGSASPPASLFWGDSHSVKLAKAVGEELTKQGQSLALHAHSGCPPILGYVRESDEDCQRFNRAVFDYLGRTPSIKRVYLTAFWTCGCYRDQQLSADRFIAIVDDTVAQIQGMGKSVVIVGPVPLQPVDVPRHLVLLARRGKLDEARSASAPEYARQSGWFTANYARWQSEGITILDPARALVEGKRTKIIADGHPLYIDFDHLSMAGARAVLAADPSR